MRNKDFPYVFNIKAWEHPHLFQEIKTPEVQGKVVNSPKDEWPA